MIINIIFCIEGDRCQLLIGKIKSWSEAHALLMNQQLAPKLTSSQ